MIEFEFIDSVNGFGGTFWEKTFILGKSWLHDKTQMKLLGYIEKSPDSDISKLWQVNEYYDEDIDDVIENNIFIGEFQTEKDAIKYGKKYFFGEE